ncbi:hypothetical protein K2173_021671 [Erythroxylum novogranatense]|uniref:AP2/ERF domain-containing protein n=1 Tax=Erythroxylum novogranatense TaxID=1862640 RepID=A0AAV8TJM7_9ROSI|nr:hypothetical protein K2173_021671 [Erythroxylum novogranatense]
MDDFSQLSDPHPFGSNPMLMDRHEETSSWSDASTGGVRKRNGNKWVCELREPNNKSRLWLGTYPTADMAARAHDVAALALRGKSACLNFADSLWRLPVPDSNDSGDIRKAASDAAELFRPQECGGNKVTKGVVVVEDSSEISSEDYKVSQEGVTFVDEETVFDMPGLLTDLAEGPLLSPPYYLSSQSGNWDDMESVNDLSLWNY